MEEGRQGMGRQRARRGMKRGGLGEDTLPPRSFLKVGAYDTRAGLRISGRREE